MCIESNMSSGLKHDEWSIVAIQFRNLMCCEKYLHMILWHTIHAVSLWSTSKIFVVCRWFKNTAANQQWPWITSILHWTLDLWLHFDRMYGISNAKQSNKCVWSFELILSWFPGERYMLIVTNCIAKCVYWCLQPIKWYAERN